MAALSQKNYRGAEFSESFKMDQTRFDDLYGKCHIFNKMDPKTKSTELAAAFIIANGVLKQKK